MRNRLSPAQNFLFLKLRSILRNRSSYSASHLNTNCSILLSDPTEISFLTINTLRHIMKVSVRKKKVIKKLSPKSLWQTYMKWTVAFYLLQYWSLSNWQNFQFRCGCVVVLENWITGHYFIIFFAIFKNVVHSLDPGETPSY